jgi:hypothetical protein
MDYCPVVSTGVSACTGLEAGQRDKEGRYLIAGSASHRLRPQAKSEEIESIIVNEKYLFLTRADQVQPAGPSILSSGRELTGIGA